MTRVGSRGRPVFGSVRVSSCLGVPGRLVGDCFCAGGHADAESPSSRQA